MYTFGITCLVARFFNSSIVQLPPWHQELQLSNGRRVLIRPIRPEDADPLRAAGRFTLPTTIARELETNPFLRADTAGVRRAVGMERAEAAAVFAELRERKNRG